MSSSNDLSSYLTNFNVYDSKILWKTRLCSSTERKQECLDSRCAFAHCKADQFKDPYCSYDIYCNDQRCKFAHLGETPSMYKRRTRREYWPYQINPLVNRAVSILSNLIKFVIPKSRICSFAHRNLPCPRKICLFAHTGNELVDTQCQLNTDCLDRSCVYSHTAETEHDFMERTHSRFCSQKRDILLTVVSQRLSDLQKWCLSLEKTEMCKFRMKGKSCHRALCCFAHSQEELKPPLCVFAHNECSEDRYCPYVHHEETKKKFVQRTGLRWYLDVSIPPLRLNQ